MRTSQALQSWGGLPAIHRKRRAVGQLNLEGVCAFQNLKRLSPDEIGMSLTRTAAFEAPCLTRKGMASGCHMFAQSKGVTPAQVTALIGAPAANKRLR